jgi:hypothetical protein
MSPPLSDIRQIAGGLEPTIALLIGLGNGKSRSSRARGDRAVGGIETVTRSALTTY